MPELKIINIEGVDCTLCDSSARLSIASIETTLTQISTAVTNLTTDVANLKTKVETNINSTTAMSLRESQLVFTETTPVVNGQIAWLCE